MTKVWTSADYQLVLAPRTRLVPVAALPKRLRTSLSTAGDDYALYRPASRSMAKIVSGDISIFLRAFLTPVSIKTAILAFARATGEQADKLVDSLFAVVNDLLQAGYLITPEDAALIRGATTRHLRIFGEYTIVRRLQKMDDVQVYCAKHTSGHLVALKVAARGQARAAADLAHEAAVLSAIGGRCAPALVQTGTLTNRAFLAMDWVQGIGVDRAADTIRREGNGQWPRLLQLASQVAAAYATLHAQGVIHGDVHPNNVLVSPSGVTLIDFGLSSLPGGSRQPRAGVDHYFEPEYAKAYLRKKVRPAATMAGEQYSVAALLFRIMSGHWYLTPTIERDVAFQQIAEAEPRRFSSVGVGADDALEGILLRALHKEPGQRFPTMRALADAMAGHCRPSAGSASSMRGSWAGLDRFVRAETAAMLDAGSGFPVRQPLPLAVNMGLAGVAYGAYRVALNLRSADLLAYADEVAERAAGMQHDEGAWFEDFLGLTQERVPRQSSFNGVAGLCAVRALIAHARDDSWDAGRRVDDFLRDSAGIEAAGPDFTFGQAGTLTACATLLKVVDNSQVGTGARLRAFGDTVEQALFASMDRELGPGNGAEVVTKTGAAHGWAGYLFAALRWHRCTGQAVTGPVLRWLDRLADRGVPVDNGLAWPVTIPFSIPEFHGGWCNGAAGQVQVWLEAFRVTGDKRWLALAEAAGWSVWGAEDAGWDLCCGRAGRAYALLELATVTGDDAWRERATTFAVQAVAEMRRAPARYVGLYRGAIGVVTLASDIASGQPRSMPFYGDEP